MSHAALGAPGGNIFCSPTASLCPGGTPDILPALYYNIVEKKNIHRMVFWPRVFIMANIV